MFLVSYVLIVLSSVVISTNLFYGKLFFKVSILSTTLQVLDGNVEKSSASLLLFIVNIEAISSKVSFILVTLSKVPVLSAPFILILTF